MSRAPITTHVLDLKTGKPAAGIMVELEKISGSSWKKLAEAKTNEDGRIEDWLEEGSKAEKGTYRVIFDVKSYFKGQSQKTFYPEVSIVFDLDNSDQHYHVPLLLSPYGYSTYRGS